MRRAIPPASIEVMFGSLSNNTLKQYNVTYKVWLSFCQENNVEPFSPSIPMIMYFLTKMYNSGASYGSLNSHKSALSLIISSKIGEDDRIKRLFKGFYKSKPPQAKYKSTWDPNIVLTVIQDWTPNMSLSLEKLSKKLVILLALSTGQRAQTLSLIKISNIIFHANYVNINITDTIKTSGPGRAQPHLHLPFFERAEICPAKTLCDYIEYTKDIRGNEDHLLLTLNKPHKSVTSSTIGRWIKNVLCISGIDTTIFSGHSTRHASTSTAKLKGVSLDVIRKTAGWSSNSSTFAKFYNQPILETSGEFAQAVLNTRIQP